MNTTYLWKDADWFERCVGRYLPGLSAQPDFPLNFGRIGMVEEGGGKRRLFAIGNYINQRLLRSYHDWLMAVLRRIPCDGTFKRVLWPNEKGLMTSIVLI